MAEVNAVPTPEDKARYDQLRKDLMQSIPKKRLIDKQLAQIELQIYNLEATYLTETAAHNGGNIIQGFEGYLKNQTSTRKKYEIGDHDRVFSNSSTTYYKSLDLTGDGDESANTEDMRQSSGPPTVVLPPAPKNVDQSLQAKRARDKEYQRRKRASASLRNAMESENEEVSSSSRRATKRARMAAEDD
ncbi:histone acetyltransferase subunit NuA4-domain-containing protein [Coprinopsis sp. MPI-PUGE-AT-0042]|nr:histone acetyltransferase subunit NuA4-domain-containing protein [Coprinopsis sp. MPI-PUGE-AT-0042]